MPFEVRKVEETLEKSEEPVAEKKMMVPTTNMKEESTEKLGSWSAVLGYRLPTGKVIAVKKIALADG